MLAIQNHNQNKATHYNVTLKGMTILLSIFTTDNIIYNNFDTSYMMIENNSFCNLVYKADSGKQFQIYNKH